MLKVRDLTKRFGGLVAVGGASLDVAEGEIVALIGPNGAGKTTVFELVSGFQRPDAGRIEFRGRPVLGRWPHELAQMGLVRTFQIVRPFTNLTVRENTAAAAHTRLAARPAALAKAEEVATALGTGGMLDQLAEIAPMIRRVRDQGATILMIEHVMQAVMNLSDRAIVLNNGAVIASGTPGEIVGNPVVIEAYLGAGMARRLAETQTGAGNA